MENAGVRVLCPNLILHNNEPAALQWLIGSPFFPPLTVVSTLKCIHADSSSSSSPDYTRESDELRTLVPKGFHVIGARRRGSCCGEEVKEGCVVEVRNWMRRKWWVAMALCSRDTWFIGCRFRLRSAFDSYSVAYISLSMRLKV